MNTNLLHINKDLVYGDLIYNEVSKISENKSNKVLKLKSNLDRKNLKHQLHIKGRIAAKKCLEKLGIKNFEILKDKSGAPIWPKGIYGSISHSRDKAVAIVSKNYNLVGIDLEHKKRDINLNLKNRICTESEKEWVGDNKEKLLSIFSTKEAIYKAFYNIEKLTFMDAELKKTQLKKTGLKKTQLKSTGLKENNQGFEVNLNLKSNPNFKFNTYLIIDNDYITSIVSLDY